MKENKWNGAAALGVILLLFTFAGLLLLRVANWIGASGRRRGTA
jgi:putative spermidine/putrescine transport system permease protein